MCLISFVKTLFLSFLSAKHYSPSWGREACVKAVWADAHFVYQGKLCVNPPAFTSEGYIISPLPQNRPYPCVGLHAFLCLPNLIVCTCSQYQKIYADIKRLPQYPRKPTPMHAATNVSMHQKNAVYHHGKKVTHNFSTNPAPSRAKTSTPPNTLRNHEQQQPQRMQRNGKRYLNPVIARTTHTYGTPSAHATYNVAKTEPVDQKRMRRSAPMPHNAPELSGPTNPAFQIHNQTLLSQTQNSVFTMLQPPLQPPIKQYPTPPPLQQTRNINLNSSVIKPPLSTHGGKAFVRPPGIPNDPPTRTLPVPEQKPKGPPKKSLSNPRASPDTGTDGGHDAKRKKTEAETKPEAKIEIHEQVDQANANLTQLFQSMLKEPRCVTLYFCNVFRAHVC